jgi:hypothetical protein
MPYQNTNAGAAREAGAMAELKTVLAAIPQTAIVSLTAASGTADNTVADVGAAFSQATLNNNFQDLATKVNAILAVLRAAGIVAP